MVQVLLIILVTPIPLLRQTHGLIQPLYSTCKPGVVGEEEAATHRTGTRMQGPTETDPLLCFKGNLPSIIRRKWIFIRITWAEMGILKLQREFHPGKESNFYLYMQLNWSWIAEKKFIYPHFYFYPFRKLRNFYLHLEQKSYIIIGHAISHSWICTSNFSFYLFDSLPSINNHQSKTQYSENPASNILAGIPTPWKGNFPSNSNWTVYGAPNNYQTIGSRHYNHTRLWW